MRVYVAWPISIALVAAILVAVVFYQRSWIPAYAEAEPLYPIVAEFGQVLAKSATSESLSASKIQATLLEDRFSAIQRCGVVFSTNPEIIVTIRVNDWFSFDIAPDGTPQLNKRQNKVEMATPRKLTDQI